LHKAKHSLSGLVGGYKEISHTADLSLSVWGETLSTFFKYAAIGMTEFMGKPSKEVPSVKRVLTLTAIDTEELLVEWLGELAYIAESENILFEDFSITEITGNLIKATLAGRISPKPLRIIKAVTYHNLKINRTNRGFETVIVFDV
jgi:SHS2 domain-containing protein